MVRQTLAAACVTINEGLLATALLGPKLSPAEKKAKVELYFKRFGEAEQTLKQPVESHIHPLIIAEASRAVLNSS